MSTLKFSLGLGLILIIVTGCSQMDSGSIYTADHSTPTSMTFFVILGAGLLTGLSHCIGMCGPLVGTFVLRRRAERKEVSTSLVLFQTGRLTTYLVLGLILGTLGAAVATTIRQWQGGFSITLGLFMAFLGLSLLGLFPLQRWLTSVSLARWTGHWLKRLMTTNHPAASFGLGLVNGLLPCGPVYAMALLAAASGAPLRGAMIMLVFGLGTLPAMLGFGFSTSLLSLRLRSSLYRLASLLVIAVGLQLTFRGLALNGQISHAIVGSIMLW